MTKQEAFSPPLKQEISFFLRHHWLHGVLLIPGFLVLVFFHEASHAIAVLLQGGQILEFVWWPSQDELGHIRCTYHHWQPYAKGFTALAPYALWCSTCLIAYLLSLRKAAFHPALASTIFVWLFLMPLTDTADSVFSYLFGNTSNDFRDALGWPPSTDIVIALLAGSFASAILGFLTQQRLYRDRALGKAAFTLLGFIALAILIGFKIYGRLSI